MPRNGSGNYSPPGANYPAVSLTLITAVNRNAVDADIATALTQSIAVDGQSVITANIPMAGFKITGIGAATARTDAASIATIQDGTGVYVGTVGGTVDAITLTPSPAITSYTAGQGFKFIASGVNTTNVTVNVSGLGAKALTKSGSTALVAGDIPSGAMVEMSYDGTRFIIGAVYAAGIPASIGTAKGDTIGFSASATPVRKAVGSDGQVIAADSSQTDGRVYIDNPSRSNLLINPNWQLDQINEGALYTVNAADVRGPDGWSGTAVGAGVFKLRTVADPENAALKCLEITCTTADAAIAATDDYFIYTAIEGYEAAALMAGTSAALAIIAQFKFKTTTTGVYGVSIANSALNRRYIGIITVADTSEHEYTVTLTLDTSGTWLYTNGVGIYMRICLSAGSNFQGTASAWAAGAEQTTSAQCNFMSVNTNTAYLKRVQLIPGALVQAYKPADIQGELAKAQRYYCKTFAQGTSPAQNAGLAAALGDAYDTTDGAGAVAWRFPASMRASPTITTYNPSAANANWSNTATAAVANTGSEGTTLTASGGVLAVANYIHATATARLS